MQITGALFGPVPAAFALLAWRDNQLAGMASYSFLWPAAGVTRSLYIKELYVAQAHRREGIGKLLMDSLFEVATKRGCSRVEWTTDQESHDAQGFYEAMGMRVNAGKLFYRVELAG